MAIDYVAYKKKYFPHLEVVCDFSKSTYSHISLEERNEMSQKELQALVDAEQEEFARSRDNTCFGGSDIACILGRGFTPPSILARKKQGIYKEHLSAETKERFKAGHRAEPMIRQAFERVTGIRTIEWPLTMVNPKYPKFRMNIDGLLFENGKIGIYEGKWTDNVAITNAHYGKMKKLRDKGIDPPIRCAPEKYLYQVWGYMAGMELDFAYICGGWGFSDNQIGYVKVPRLPKDDEESLMQLCDEYMDIVNAGGIPSDADFENKGALLALYEKMAPTIPSSGNKKVFSKTDAAAAREYLKLKDEITDLDNQLKKISDAFKEEHEYAQKTDSIKMIEAYFKEELMTDRFGTAKDAKGSISISYDEVPGRKSFHKDLCEAKYPDIFKEVYGPEKKRKLIIEEVGDEK